MLRLDQLESPYDDRPGEAVPSSQEAAQQRHPGRSRATGLTVDQYAEAKRLPVAFLRELGLRDVGYADQQAVAIPYRVTGDTAGAVRYRLTLEGPDRFRWRRGDKAIPYGLSQRNLGRARRDGLLYLVEGESDSQTLWHHGLPALGFPGSSTAKMLDHYAHLLEGIAVMYVLVEPDAGGRALVRVLSGSTLRDRIRVMQPPGGFKDVSALHLSGAWVYGALSGNLSATMPLPDPDTPLASYSAPSLSMPVTPVQRSNATRSGETRPDYEALKRARAGGDLSFDTEAEREASAARIRRLLQYVVASREYQFA